MTSAESWDERYRTSDRIWSRRPNPHLVTEVDGLPPGRALDVGSGEGADVIWLAGRGWTVVGVDISAVALERAALHVAETRPELAERITWLQADLLTDPPRPESFDLVTVHFMQLPPETRTTMFRALVAAVRPNGSLLVVGHDVGDHATGVGRPHGLDLYYPADEVAALLDHDWHVVVNEARPRPATTHDGVDVTVRDAVLRARRAGP